MVLESMEYALSGVPCTHVMLVHLGVFPC